MGKRKPNYFGVLGGTSLYCDHTSSHKLLENLLHFTSFVSLSLWGSRTSSTNQFVYMSRLLILILLYLSWVGHPLLNPQLLCNFVYLSYTSYESYDCIRSFLYAVSSKLTGIRYFREELSTIIFFLVTRKSFLSSILKNIEIGDKK